MYSVHFLRSEYSSFRKYFSYSRVPRAQALPITTLEKRSGSTSWKETEALWVGRLYLKLTVLHVLVSI